MILTPDQRRHARSVALSPRLYRTFLLVLGWERRHSSAPTLDDIAALFGGSARVHCESLLRFGWITLSPGGVVRTARDANGFLRAEAN